MKNNPLSIFWFRRDLRLEDNAGLYYALHSGNPVLALFIFDSEILDKLENKQDPRVQFIHQQITTLHAELEKKGSTIVIRYGKPKDVFKELIKEFEIKSVYANHDYEPTAIERDQSIEVFLKKHNISFLTYKDQCVFEKDEVMKDDGKPYTVFTPYMKKWKLKLNSFYLKSYPSIKGLDQLFKTKALPVPRLEELGFLPVNINPLPNQANESQIRLYNTQRDFPGIAGTSKLGTALRFGTISIRKLAKDASEWNETFLNELIWRDFYMMILYHFPHVVNGAFKPAYDKIPWRNNEDEFKRWCEGNTGYPIVDAGMRELNQTGYMHNRIRMVVASFLTKHLLIDWRWGEAYFASRLMDFELSSNNGGWQWAAGSGCDAAPYFRIFNPYEQTRKFDPNHVYIKKWVPEWQELTYPTPIVEHTFARNRALETYKKELNNTP
jgi:deoxyribodipyrimidine photo-lyase